MVVIVSLKRNNLYNKSKLFKNKQKQNYDLIFLNSYIIGKIYKIDTYMRKLQTIFFFLRYKGKGGKGSRWVFPTLDAYRIEKS
jgi:hypothetical protein